MFHILLTNFPNCTLPVEMACRGVSNWREQCVGGNSKIASIPVLNTFEGQGTAHSRHTINNCWIDCMNYTEIHYVKNLLSWFSIAHEERDFAK